MSKKAMPVESIASGASYILQDFLDWHGAVLGSSDRQIEELNMKELLSHYGSHPTDNQFKGKVSRRGLLRLAAVAPGGSVAALA